MLQLFKPVTPLDPKKANQQQALEPETLPLFVDNLASDETRDQAKYDSAQLASFASQLSSTDTR
jgi:hypothetical protein